MSEATSSPSGAISSSSSSLSSPTSAPISEPTSDEQPDLGAFVTVLREFNHLQPPPRIPIQIRSATSSTTPTFHSVSGAELRSRSGRTGNSRIGSHGAGSTLSSFTRPPSSSVHPDGSTVWNHALIASYLNNSTPSNDVITDDEEYEEMGGGYQYTPASVALTVEIASEIEYSLFDERSHDSNPPFVEMSPYPQSDSVIPLPVILESDTQRLDSRETAHLEDDLERSTDRDHGDTSSATSRDIRPFLEDPVSTATTTNSQNHSRSESHLTSVQLQSQARPNTTTVASPSSSLSYPTLPSSGVAPYISSVSVPQQPSSPENNPRNVAITGNSPTYLASLLNRSQNPIPPRTTSDSSLTTTGSASSSSLSLLSYQIIETPPLPVEEESDPETSTRPSLPRQPMPATTSTNTMASLSTTSLTASLKTQRSLPSQADSSSASTNSFATQRQYPVHQVFNESTGAVSQTSLPASVSRLPNPHSPRPSPEPELPRAEVGFNSHSSIRDGWIRGRITARDIGIVNDLGTPDQLPSEVPPLDPPRERTQEYHAVLDENVADDISLLRVPDSRTKVQTTQKSVYTSDRPGTSTRGTSSSRMQVPLERNPLLEPQNEDDEEDEDYPYRYPYSHSHTPRYHGQAQTPRGPPPASEPRPPTQTTSNTQANSSFIHQSAASNHQSVSQLQSQNLQKVFVVPHETQNQIQPVPPQPQPQPPSSSSLQPQITRNLVQPPTTLTQHQTQQTQPTKQQQQQQQQHNPSYSYSSYAPSQPPTTNVQQNQTHTISTSSSFTETAPNQRPGYPHSLIGLHALPASFISPEPEDLPDPLDGSPQQARTTRPDNVTSTDSNVEAQGLDADDLESPLPSLGYLDEALSYIAAERARWRAVQEGQAASSAVTGAASEPTEGVGSGDDGEGEGEGQEGDAGGDGEWRNVVENGQEQPKRKRRRKRPPRSHASAQATSGGEVTSASAKTTSTVLDATPDVASNVLPATPVSSPKRKKRSKSVPASAAASAVSLVLDSEKPRSSVKAKGKEKEFLVPVPTLPQSSGSGKEKEKEKERPPVTILRRPVPEPEPKESVFSEEEDDSDGHGGRTPTNFSSINGGMQRSLGSVLDGSSSLISLMGKKGRRVGRKERDKEKMKMDLMKGGLDIGSGDVNPQPATSAGDGGDFGAEYNDADGDEDDEDEGVEPQEEEDENVVGTNDSLAGLSLLQPPRRKRSRSRRRKGRDTTYIHTLAGITDAYKSTPATPGRAKGVISDEMEEVGGIVKASTDESHSNEVDVFESKPNETPGSEKRKRTRTKRVKALVHSTSVPQLKVDTTEMGQKPAEEQADNDNVSVKTVKPKKGKSKVRPVEDEEDILDMDRNQLRQLITESARVGSRLLLAGGQPPEPQAPLAPETKRGRLLTLARKLKQLFPEQHEELGRVIARIEGTETTANSWLIGDVKRFKAVSIPAGKKKKPKKGGHVRTGSEGTSVEAFDLDDHDEDDAQASRPAMNAFPDIEEEEDEEIDPRGRPPKKGDVLVHVFIDHSNILIGLLSHLKRNQPKGKNFANITRGRPLPALITKATAITASTNEKPNPVSAFAAVKSTTARPLPVPIDNIDIIPSTSSKRQQPIVIPKGGHPIPLPSFATLSRSLPTESFLTSSMASRSKAAEGSPSSDDYAARRDKEANSDGYEHPEDEDADVVANAPFPSFRQNKEKKALKHLWHAALTLILERGRPVTRRVVVTSSPLYQPMESIERLGYELRVFIRVPDLGDGQDRERYRDKHGSGKSSGGGKSAQSSPVKSTFPVSAKKDRGIGHVRRLSGSTSAESGSGGAGSLNAAAGGGSLHPYFGITNGSVTPAKIKYREQGVDELLQLKLHQALAATDDVPEGSTIVLATGDGNIGQFNEDGFLGPVRTALRRGWRVELYAWEDGLSRAWRREFGEGSEFGRSGMFRIIGMEQFASGLVEVSGWS